MVHADSISRRYFVAIQEQTKGGREKKLGEFFVASLRISVITGHSLILPDEAPDETDLLISCVPCDTPVMPCCGNSGNFGEWRSYNGGNGSLNVRPSCRTRAEAHPFMD